MQIQRNKIHLFIQFWYNNFMYACKNHNETGSWYKLLNGLIKNTQHTTVE